MMLFYYFICISIVLTYVSLILFLLYQWQKEEPEIPNPFVQKHINYSILIPVRNESDNIIKCIQSILSNKDFDLNRIEIIVIDDFSEDNTIQLIENLNHPLVRLLKLNELDLGQINAYKKAALNYGLKNANGEYIIQLDGDVVLGKNYLKVVDEFITRKIPDFIAAPVLFEGKDNWFNSFQKLDLLGMMIVTQAGIKSKNWFMANGANMIYKRKIFNFDPKGMASGDDIYSIQKIASNPQSKIYFLNSIDVAVTTQPPSTIKNFISQRLRWGTKNKTMSSKMKFMMLIPFVNALMLVAHFFLYFFFGKMVITLLAFHFGIKLIVDYIYLKEAAIKFEKEDAMSHYLSSAFLHPIYLVVVGVMSLFISKYVWKGRKVY